MMHCVAFFNFTTHGPWESEKEKEKGTRRVKTLPHHSFASRTNLIMAAPVPFRLDQTKVCTSSHSNLFRRFDCPERVKRRRDIRLLNDPLLIINSMHMIACVPSLPVSLTHWYPLVPAEIPIENTLIYPVLCSANAQLSTFCLLSWHLWIRRPAQWIGQWQYHHEIHRFESTDDQFNRSICSNNANDVQHQPGWRWWDGDQSDLPAHPQPEYEQHGSKQSHELLARLQFFPCRTTGDFKNPDTEPSDNTDLCADCSCKCYSTGNFFKITWFSDVRVSAYLFHDSSILRRSVPVDHTSLHSDVVQLSSRVHFHPMSTD